MRATFILLRLVGYGIVLIYAFTQAGSWSWWEWVTSMGIFAFCVWDLWKKPSAPVPTMRLGIGIETALVFVWAFVIQDTVVLFVLLSPLVRSCVHLKWQDSSLLFLIEVCSIGWFHQSFHSHPYLYIQMILLLIVGAYAFVLGALLKEREMTKRLLEVSVFERELRAKEEERMRITGQLHDRTGQYWSAIIRALDVALRLDGDRREEFITKARAAAMDGLQEMRTAVTEWNEGRQTPSEWLNDMENSVTRFSQLTGIQVLLELPPTMDWHRFEHPTAIAETIARTVIESMTNAVRHGEAQIIEVVVEALDNEVRISIKDNGKGFGAFSTKSYGIGIKTMRELAQAVGGNWEITNAREQGAIVSVTLPYHREMGVVSE
ncbi:sensor histidine kinase [Cohnella sp. WQ 127256]|uniref:sensor histidine kinase n=1 Tax=Cohnella sp. WQ 127256 TaxID=2938790 RepID=UPI0021190210|nr:ATP-binding protein [Cohnella sp. WQ 127256]